MGRTIELDAIDWKILGELQADGGLTNVELARRVGLTPPPCLRRVHALRDAGLIRGYRAILDAPQLGYSVVCFAFVHLASQAETDLQAFAERIRLWPSIRECWTLSGDIDFLLKCVTRDLPSLQALVLISQPPRMSAMSGPRSHLASLRTRGWCRSVLPRAEPVHWPRAIQ